MFPVTSMATLGARRAFSHAPPRGTCSKIASLRLRRRSRTMIAKSSTRRSLYTSVPGQSVTPGDAIDTVSNQEFGLFRDFLSSSPNQFPKTAPSSISKPSISEPVDQLAGPLRKAVSALQQGDIRRLIINLRPILKMERADLQAAMATLPRSTFTEIIYALDPLKISRKIDPTDGVNITTGMYQVLGMGPYIDDWGIRKVYVELLEIMHSLVVALRATGQVLHAEEYTYLLRCAGAASDLVAARWLWIDIGRSKTKAWRQSETFNEYLSARFLTRPLYNGFDKVRKVVTPRDLHRSRIKLDSRSVTKLDRLRLNVRIKRMYFGLNKGIGHAEDLKRATRKTRPISRLFYYTLLKGHLVREDLLYTAIISFGRAGSLRFIGSKILRRYFGIQLGRLVYEERQFAPNNLITSTPCPVRPSYRLMGAIVDAYGSNGEIALAYQLIDHISNTANIRIPRSIWHELLEWTYILSAPPISTMWKQAGMHFKIPNPSAVELIFNTMVEYGVQPRFEAYIILIRNIIARRQFSKILPLMEKAIEFYNNASADYEEAVLEYAQLLRDGVSISEAIIRYEQARFMKARIWYDIQTTCRQFLLKVRGSNIDNPLTTAMIPNFIHKFRAFIPNPALYRTPTGHVSLFDPAREKQQTAFVRHLPMSVPMKHKGRWLLQRTKAQKVDLVHEHSLLGHLPMAKLGLDSLFISTCRKLRRPSSSDAPRNEPSVPYDDDDEFY